MDQGVRHLVQLVKGGCELWVQGEGCHKLNPRQAVLNPGKIKVYKSALSRHRQ